MTTDDARFEPAPALPGLEDFVPSNLPPLVAALHRTIAALDALELLDEVHAVDLEAMRLLARSAGIKVTTGRASTVANDVDLLLRIKQNIVTPPTEGEGTVDAELRDAMAKFEAALDGADLDA
jgi:hypothetical protein